MNIVKQLIPHPLKYLTATELAEIDHEISIMETREAAGIEALKIVQANRGWISDDSLMAIAAYLKMSSAELEGVATFYNLIYRQPVGKHVIHLCDSVSCHLTGYAEVLAAIKGYLNIDYGQTTDDGLFTLLSNACLGGCDKSPVMMIGQQHYQQLTADTAIDILQQYQQGVEQVNGEQP
ncbi:NADH-quinone oxidoreductase subunit E [Thalassotalea insulae]|uniref:NADH-quinone oxidoreductase subunit E n=1 Tax=Thalassotalea insulae TaxID=2056778 RepID=A0ABQ6GQ42_9GAMM|nr:NADH-quinone oxidoreductase subunit NuoE [Thalassotalea insulae]GLX77512.1 NADH-quinone oxidoreductase subunit E [Thalassotalea insulae]